MQKYKREKVNKLILTWLHLALEKGASRQEICFTILSFLQTFNSLWLAGNVNTFEEKDAKLGTLEK